MRIVWICLHLALAAPALGAAEPAGKVAKVTGVVQALRNPSKAAKPPKTEAAAQAKYANQYWEATPLKEGSAVEFGDVLSASPQGKTQIQLDSGFNVILAPNAKLRLSRAIAGRLSTGSVVDLLSGAMRAVSRDAADEQGTTFKTRTIVMGVRGTDFSVVAFPRETEVVVVEGAVAVRNMLSPEAAATAEVVLTTGQATRILNAPEDQDFEAMRQSLPAAEYERAVAAYDPKPAEPATADQARRIRDFSEGIAGAAEQQDIQTLVEERTAAETAQPPKNPAPAPQPDGGVKGSWLGLEISIGTRGIKTDARTDLPDSGAEPRVAADVAPFSFPLAFGLAVSRVALRDASEQAVSPHLRYTLQLSEDHALFTRLGLRMGKVEHEGKSYASGGLWLGFGYRYSLSGSLKALVQLDAYPGAIEIEGEEYEWGGGAMSAGLRFEL